MMTITEINQLSIKEYLADLNIHPVKDRGYYSMYHSPFRKDHDASMKIDFSKNLWIDFGSGEGGTMIDLVMRLNNCTVKEAITTLERKYEHSNDSTYKRMHVPTNTFSFHGNTDQKSESNILILKILPITNKALIDYLTERKINIETAKRHCKEIYYSVNNKTYFAIGFKNDSGGYELRNKYFKGCTSKDISTSKNDTKTCLVFEGFMDYLSYLTMKNIKNSKMNSIVLNSINNLPKAIEFIKSHTEVHTYLDNDEAGKRASEQIKKIGNNVIDKSTEYAKYKDLNQWLCNTKQAQQRKPSRGFKM